MSDLGLAFRQARYENRAFWRNPPSAFFTFAFPLMFLFIFNLLFGGTDIPIAGGKAKASTFLVPAIAAFSIITATYTNIAISVAFAKDKGLLKRYRGTPLPSWAYLFGKIGHSAFLAVLLVAVVVIVGRFVYEVQIPTNTMPAFIITLVIGAATFCALGLAVTAIIPNGDAAPAVVNAIILPLLLISDVFVHIVDPPAWLDTLGNVFPVKPLSQALQTAFNPFEPGAGFEPEKLAVVAAWGVAGVILAVLFFRWEPKK